MAITTLPPAPSHSVQPLHHHVDLHDLEALTGDTNGLPSRSQLCIQDRTASTLTTSQTRHKSSVTTHSPLNLFPYSQSIRPLFLQPKLHDSCGYPCRSLHKEGDLFVSPSTCAPRLDTAAMQPLLCTNQHGNSLFRHLRVYSSGMFEGFVHVTVSCSLILSPDLRRSKSPSIDIISCFLAQHIRGLVSHTRRTIPASLPSILG
jgi:hypothetical protein